MKRGRVLPLTAQQRWARMMYLAGKASVHELDEHVLLKTDTPDRCPDGFYLLTGHNGGKDPTAADPFDRWSKGSSFVNRTADCIGGMAWCGGFDRFQEERFPLYGGWINTDSMYMDAVSDQVCFEQVRVPELGCFVVCMSGSRGHTIGHIGGIVSVPLEWSPLHKDCWRALAVVDVAARSPARANQMTSGLGWFDTGAQFVRPIMKAA